MIKGSVRVLATALASAAALMANAASAETKCRLLRYFEVPVTVEGPAAFMDVKVNGVDSRFQIDTGAFFSIVTPDGAKRLRLTCCWGLPDEARKIGLVDEAAAAPVPTPKPAS